MDKKDFPAHEILVTAFAAILLTFIFIKVTFF